MPRRKQTLRSRLTTLVIVAIFGAVAIATASSVWREIAQYGDGKRTELYASANIFATAISEPVYNSDKAGTLNALRAISYLPSVEYVRVNTLDENLFVELGSATAVRDSGFGLIPENSALAMLTSRSAAAMVPIVRGGETIAHLTLHADTGSLSDRIGQLLYDAFVAAVFAGGIGVLIALKMQRAITDPILGLARVMSKVRESGDFSVRANQVSDEETAQLVDTFNTMLDHIQERDSKLQTHQRTLEKTVDQRTRELRKAKDSAEAANLAKSDFLATMSHEIRTPMNGMLAMADLLSKASLAPRHKRYAEVIAKSGQSLLAIINDILDFSKIEAGRLDLESIPVRPADILDDVVGLFWERATSKGIDLAAYVAPNAPEEILGDPVRISQILSNLVNNALKFTEDGHVIVSVSVKGGGELAKDSPCALEFSVTDTGVGIAKEKQDAIFEAFSQADQSTTRRYGGTGLGLAICRKLVEAMNGHIGLASRPGKGSKFFFSMESKVVSPPRRVRQTETEKRAVIAVDGTAAPKMLSSYLRECGIIPHIVESNSALGPHIAYADMIFASPEFYRVYQQTISAGKAQWIPARICVCELGDTAPDLLVESGVVEDILLSPLSRREVMDQIGRILDDKLRGKAALANAESANAQQMVFKGQRVLAADDSAVNREVVQEALARLNLSVTLAGNGKEALSLARDEEFDLILMDCSMPEMDGFESTLAIRAFEKHSGRVAAPIVALTAHAAGSDTTWKDAGMDDYLTKPFTLDSLAAVIGKYLEGEQRTAAPSKPIATKARDERPAGIFDKRVLNDIASMQTSGANLPLRALTLFEQHSRDALKTLAVSLKEGEAGAIAKAAHALKSMSLNVGARDLANSCSAVEDAARGNAERVELLRLCKSVSSDFRAVHGALPAMMNEYRSIAA